MNASDPVVIATMAALSVLALAMSFVPGRNPLAMRIERMQAINERTYDTRLARIQEIVAGEPLGNLRTRLLAGGWYGVTPLAFVLRGLAGILVGLCFAVYLFRTMDIKPLAIAVGVGAVALGWRLPKIALDRAISKRRREIERALPDFLDLLSATVQAGLALSGAMIAAADATVGALRQELTSALAEIRLGRQRSDALKSMAERVGEPQLTAMVSTILQAEALGANIATVLRELALDTRHRRWTLAEERAARLPIKMLLPMAFLMMPSLYVMIFGPVVANMAKSLVR